MPRDILITPGQARIDLSGLSASYLYMLVEDDGSLTFHDASGAVVSIGTASVSVPTGTLSMGTSDRQSVNLKGSAYGIGTQSAGLYSRSSGSFAWFRGGSHSSTTGDPGSGGSRVLELGSSSLDHKSSGSADSAISTSAPAGHSSALTLKSSDVSRWTIARDSSAESGSNVGSSLVVSRHDDSGAVIDAPVTISRNTGVVSFSEVPIASGASVVTSTRSISTAGGSGLSGGGDLSSNRSIALDVTGISTSTAVSGSHRALVFTDGASGKSVRTWSQVVADLGIWTSSNDGAGSALDADLLDGQHGSHYLDLANSTGTLASARLPSPLAAIYSLAPSANALPYFTGSGTASTTTLSGFARSLLDDADASAARATLGLVIGTNVQQYDAELTALAGVTSSADALPYFTGSGTASTTTLSSFARTLLDDTSASAAQATLNMVLDTDSTLASDSDTRVPSQKAIRTYIDSLLSGYRWRVPVRVVSTSDGDIATAYAAGQTVDGVVLVAGDRVLLAGQSTASQNGIYVVNSSGAPTRSTDADHGSELPSATVMVSSGTANADSQWTCTNDSVVLGSTSVSFVKISGSGLGVYYAGFGLSLTGSTFAVNDAELVALAGLTSAADALPYFTGSGTASTTTLSSFGRNLIDDADASAARATLGLVIGTNVQQYDAELTALAGLTSAANALPYFTGTGTASTTTLSSFGRNLIDDADATAARTTLGLGTAATQNTGTSGANVPLLNASNTWSAQQGFSANIVMSYASPSLFFDESDQGTDAKRWRHQANAAQYTFDLANDAYDAFTNVYTVTRSGYSSPVVNFPSGTTVQFAGQSLSAFGRNLIDDADATAARTTLGLGTAATQNTGTSGANVPLLNASNTWGGGQTFSGGLVVSASAADIRLHESDGASNEKYFSIYQNASTTAFRFLDDSYANPVSWLSVARTGTTATSIALTSTALTWNGNSLFTTANDGTGSGLDADLLDGYHVGTSGSTVPVMSAANSWSGNQRFSSLSVGADDDVMLYINSGANNLDIRYGASGSYQYAVFDSTGKLTNPRLRLSATEDASLSSTLHALQVGEDAGLNIAVDQNEIMARNNGAASPLYLNSDGGNVLINGSLAWHAGNDGTGSGLDADLLDGYHVGTSGSTVPIMSAANTWAGGQTFSGGVTLSATAPDLILHESDGAANSKFFSVRQDAGSLSFRFLDDSYANPVSWLSVARTGTTATSIALTSTALTWNGNSLFTTANDGTGSGLDADLLDGQHGASYMRSDAAQSFTGVLTGNRATDTVAIDLATNNNYLSARIIGNYKASGADGIFIGYGNSNSGLTRIYGGGSTAASGQASVSMDATTFNLSGSNVSSTIYIANHSTETARYPNASVFQYSGNAADGTEVGGHGRFQIHRSRGNLGSPTAVSSGDSLGEFHFIGRRTSGWADGAIFQAYAASTFTDSIFNTNMRLYLGNGAGQTVRFRADYDGNLWAGDGTNKIWHEGNDGSGSTLDADTLDGVHYQTLQATLGTQVTGGGTLTVGASYDINWSTRFIAISIGRNSSIGTSGYFEMTVPTDGTVITGVGGASDATVTSGRITLPSWGALYYVLPIGSSNASVAANYRIASYTVDFTPPANWVRIAFRNGDNSNVFWCNGAVMPVNTQYSHSTYSSMFVPDADKLDGQHGTSYMRSDAAQSFTGLLTGNLSSTSTAIDLATNDNYLSARVINNSKSTGDGMFIGYNMANSGLMRIYGGGSVSSNVTINSSGDLTASGNVTAYSDLRLKTDLKKIASALDKVLSVTGYTYRRTDSPEGMEGELHAGVVAQEVQLVAPELVKPVGDGKDLLAVNYNGLVAYLIESVKELSRDVDSLSKRIDGIERTIH